MESTRQILQPKMKSVITLSPLTVTDDNGVIVTCHHPLKRSVTVTTFKGMTSEPEGETP
jgi:hypothetical protein